MQANGEFFSPWFRCFAHYEVDSGEPPCSLQVKLSVTGGWKEPLSLHDFSNIWKLCRSTFLLAGAGISGQPLLFPPPHRSLTVCHLVLTSKPYLIWGREGRGGDYESWCLENTIFISCTDTTAVTSGKIRSSKSFDYSAALLTKKNQTNKKRPSVLGYGGKRRFKIPTLAFIGVMSHPSPHRREYR